MRAAGDLVDAVGLARGDVHADKRDTGGDGLAGVRVHEVQVVVGVGEDLEQQGVIALRRGAAGGGGGGGGAGRGRGRGRVDHEGGRGGGGDGGAPDEYGPAPVNAGCRREALPPSAIRPPIPSSAF